VLRGCLRWVLIGVCVSAAGCQRNGVPLPDDNAGEGAGALVFTLSDPPGLQSVQAGPVTTAGVALPDSTRRALQESMNSVLRIDGVTSPGTEPVTVDVFVNNPDANENTPGTHPSFAGSFTLLPGRNAEPLQITVPLRSAAHALLGASAPVQLTLVPHGMRGARAPESFAYDRIQLVVRPRAP
jgi:hypothetical protein